MSSHKQYQLPVTKPLMYFLYTLSVPSLKSKSLTITPFCNTSALFLYLYIGLVGCI